MLLKENGALKEAPLGYWEESSYMLAVPKDESKDMLDGIFERVSCIDGVKIIKKSIPTDKEPGSITLTYHGEEYEVGFYVGSFSLPKMFGKQSYYFSDEEMKSLKKASKAMEIFMKFNEDSKKSFHLQIKLAAAMVPDLIGLMDESAEKMFCARWVKMVADSKVTPRANDLFLVQAVTDKSGEVWLHTHGLCRCGITELEILKSDKENYNNHYNLISTFASYLLDKKREFVPKESSAYIGILANNQPVVVTYIPWTKALKEYKEAKLGNVSDREQGHNSKTSVIFLYKSEEDEKNKKLSKVSEYNSLWGDNPIFFISNEETAIMKALAMERFHFVKEESTKKDNNIIIKIGLPIDSSGENFEHIWFELIEFDGERFKARLLQEPYDIENIHEGYENWYTVDDVTDWIIYRPDFNINPSSAYVLL